MSFDDSIKQELFNSYLEQEFQTKKAQVESVPKKKQIV